MHTLIDQIFEKPFLYFVRNLKMNVNLAQMTNLSFKNILLIQKDPWLAKIVVLEREVAWLTGKSGASGSSDLSSNPRGGEKRFIFFLSSNMSRICFNIS